MGSNTIGTLAVFTLRAPSRRSVRCAAIFPTCSAGSRRLRLRATENQIAYWVVWRAGRAGKYRFCVRATDGSGNRSRLACAAIRVR